MAGPETQPAEDLHYSDDFNDSELADVEGGIKSTRELANEIEGMRKNFMRKVESDGEGVVSELDSHRFVREARSLKSREEIRRLEQEFGQQLIAQRKLMEDAARILGKNPDLLNKNEESEIMTKFPDMTMRQKEKELDRIERMMAEREKKIRSVQGMDKEVKERLEKDLQKADDYEARLKTIDKANETNKNFQKYKKLWDTPKVADRTKAETFDWFLSLSPAEQKSAIDRARKEAIEPRVALYDLHEKLPSKYQSGSFSKMSKTDRVKHLNSVEQEATKDFARMLWSKDTDMSPQSKAFALKSFEQLQGKDNKVEGLDKILGKIEFLKSFPAHAKAEADLRTQLEKFPPNLYGQFVEQFNRSSFEDKTKIIDNLAKMEEKFNKAQAHFNKFKPEIKKHFEAPFENAKDLEERLKVIDQVEKFQEQRKAYFKLRTENNRFFATDVKTYEDWYNEHITNLDEARNATRELKKMIEKRKKLHEGFENLDPRVKERCKNFDELSTDKKVAKLKELRKVENNLEAIDALRESGKVLEESELFDQALKLYKQAYKLDPGNKDTVDDVNRLAQKLNKPEDAVKLAGTVEEKGDDDEAGMLDDLAKSENINFTQTEVQKTQRAEEAVEMVEDNLKNLSGNIEEDSLTRAKKEYKGGTDLEQEIIDQVSNKDRVVDKTGKAQKVLHTDLKNEEDLKRVQNEVLTPRKRDVKRGVAYVEIKDKQQTKVTKRDSAREQLDARKNTIIDGKVDNVLSKLKGKGVDFTPEQMEAMEEAIRDQAEEELDQKVDSSKIYSKAA